MNPISGIGVCFVVLFAPLLLGQQENVGWANLGFVSDGGGTNTITKTGVNNAWDSGASSDRAIASGNGYVEFTAEANNTYWMAGLSHGDSSYIWQEIDYALYACGNGYAYAYDDSGKHWLAPYTAGTVFRIEISGGNVLYKMDGVVMHQHATTPFYPLLLDASIYSPGAVISNAVISGTLIDARDIQDVYWTNLVNVSDNGGTNSITKTGTNSSWDAGASSLKAIESGPGYAEFTATANNIYLMAGLSHGDSNTLWQDIDYPIYLCGNGWAYVYDETGKHWLAPYNAGTVFRVEIEEPTDGVWNVIYKMNGVAMLQHPTTPNYPLVLDASIYSPNALISDAVIAGKLIDSRLIQNVVWTNKVNVDDNGGTNTLTKTGSYSAWDAGASSVKALASGDGYTEFTAMANNTYWMAGLSHGDTSLLWQEIDYAVYACGNGFAYAYDDTGKYWLGPYTAGTIFRVEIAGSNVLYRMNGIVVAQHATTPTYPLVLDTSIFSPGAVISNAILAGNLQ